MSHVLYCHADGNLKTMPQTLNQEANKTKQ
jgi:hypothetical protein